MPRKRRERTNRTDSTVHKPSDLQSFFGTIEKDVSAAWRDVSDGVNTAFKFATGVLNIVDRGADKLKDNKLVGSPVRSVMPVLDNAKDVRNEVGDIILDVNDTANAAGEVYTGVNETVFDVVFYAEDVLEDSENANQHQDMLPQRPQAEPADVYIPPQGPGDEYAANQQGPIVPPPQAPGDNVNQQNRMQGVFDEIKRVGKINDMVEGQVPQVHQNELNQLQDEHERQYAAYANPPPPPGIPPPVHPIGYPRGNLMDQIRQGQNLKPLAPVENNAPVEDDLLAQIRRGQNLKPAADRAMAPEEPQPESLLDQLRRGQQLKPVGDRPIPPEEPHPDNILDQIRKGRNLNPVGNRPAPVEEAKPETILDQIRKGQKLKSTVPPVRDGLQGGDSSLAKRLMGRRQYLSDDDDDDMKEFENIPYDGGAYDGHVNGHVRDSQGNVEQLQGGMLKAALDKRVHYPQKNPTILDQIKQGVPLRKSVQREAGEANPDMGGYGGLASHFDKFMRGRIEDAGPNEDDEDPDW